MNKELAESLEPTEVEDTQEAPEAEAPQEPKAEEAPETPEEEAKPEKPPKGFVPHGALHEERQKRKEMEAQLQRIQQETTYRQQLMEQRLQQLYQSQQQANQPKPPSYEDDPLGNLKHTQELTQQQIQQLNDRYRQEAENRNRYEQAQAYKAQLESVVQSDVAQFSQEHPDYLEALGHARQTRVRQHMAIGLSEAEAVQLMYQEEYQLAEAALQRGKSPAQAAYDIAKAYGWTKGKPSSETKIETLQKGVKAAQSLGSGGTPTGTPSIDQLADMSDDEFAAFKKSGGWEKLVG